MKHESSLVEATPERWTKRGRPVEPLSETEVHTMELVGQRLQASLREMLEALPVKPGSISELSRLLSIDRNLCQRAVQASESEQPLDVWSYLPGTDGLQMTIRALGKRASSPEPLARALAAAADYEAAIAAIGGSQRRLLARLGLTRKLERDLLSIGLEVDAGYPQREAIYAPAAELAGVCAEGLVVVAVLPESPEDGLLLAHGFHGASVRPGSTGLPLPWANDVFDGDPSTILEAFTTLSARDLSRQPVLAEGRRYLSTEVPTSFDVFAKRRSKSSISKGRPKLTIGIEVPVKYVLIEVLSSKPIEGLATVARLASAVDTRLAHDGVTLRASEPMADVERLGESPYVHRSELVEALTRMAGLSEIHAVRSVLSFPVWGSVIVVS